MSSTRKHSCKNRSRPSPNPSLQGRGATIAWLRPFVAFAIGVSLVAIGCGKQPPAPAPPPTPPKVAAKPADPPPFPVTPAHPAPPAEVEPPAPPARKLAVFTPSGLLLVDLAITVDGEPLDDAVAQLARRLVAAADADGDGRTGWDELADNRRFLSGPLAGGAIRTERSERRRWRELYDADGDGRVDRREALAWLDRDSSGGRLGLSLRGGRSYTPSLVASATWRTLDADSSGALSPDEIAAAPERLLSRDVNDDRVIAPSELLSLADLTRLRLEGNPLASGMASSPYNDAAFRSALLVDTDADARDAQSTLASFGGAPTDPRVFGFAERLAAAVDGDGNGYLAKAEWPRLRAADAHARLDVSYQPGDDGSPAPRFVPVFAEERVSIAEDPRDAARFQVTVAPSSEAGGADAGGVLLVATVDEAGAVYPEQQVTETFDRLDADGDDKLTAEELEAGAQGLGGLTADALLPYDEDGDAAASYDEVAAYLADATARDRLSVSVVVNDAADPHFATLDLDGDGRLGEREIDRAAETLRGATLSGSTRPDAAPWRMRLTVYRTRRQLDAMDRGPAAPSQREAPDAPAWFLGADTNRDGEISRREFIGDAAAFAEYDTDGDGYLTTEEIGVP